MKWPKRVPILRPEDFCKCIFEKPDGRRCLDSWRYKVFGAMVRGAGRVAFDELLRQSKGRHTMAFNDDPQTSLRAIAATWNRTVRSLGYVVPDGEMEI